jgi:hypothetical protein
MFLGNLYFLTIMEAAFCGPHTYSCTVTSTNFDNLVFSSVILFSSFYLYADINQQKRVNNDGCSEGGEKYWEEKCINTITRLIVF